MPHIYSCADVIPHSDNGENSTCISDSHSGAKSIPHSDSGANLIPHLHTWVRTDDSGPSYHDSVSKYRLVVLQQLPLLLASVLRKISNLNYGSDRNDCSKEQVSQSPDKLDAETDRLSDSCRLTWT
jgi:hypothetical protein